MSTQLLITLFQQYCLIIRILDQLSLGTNPNFTIPSSTAEKKDVKDQPEPNLRGAAELDLIILL